MITLIIMYSSIVQLSRKEVEEEEICWWQARLKVSWRWSSSVLVSMSPDTAEGWLNPKTHTYTETFCRCGTLCVGVHRDRRRRGPLGADHLVTAFSRQIKVISRLLGLECKCSLTAYSLQTVRQSCLRDAGKSEREKWAPKEGVSASAPSTGCGEVCRLLSDCSHNDDDDWAELSVNGNSRLQWSSQSSSRSSKRT